MLNRIKYSTENSEKVFRVYLGSAPGTGKTYMMLEDANYLLEHGIDAVAGYVETHGRKETEAEIGNMEVIPRKKISYRGSEFEELDSDAVIARKPAIALIDELAHNNVPGSKNLKRYQDAIEIFRSGISIFTTLNIFHLNSIAEKVESELGIKVGERVPDYILNYVTEIINVDIPAGELINRLKEGKIYSRDKIAMALENFFKLDNLLILRELALRTIADEVSSQATKIGTQENRPELKSNEKVLVLISSNPDSARLVRIASRLAGRLNSNLYALHINTENRQRSKNLPENYDKTLSSNISIAENLGAAVFSFQACDVVSGVIDFVKSNDISHIVIGATDEKKGLFRFFKKSIVTRLIENLPNASFHVIPTRSASI